MAMVEKAPRSEWHPFHTTRLHEEKTTPPPIYYKQSLQKGQIEYRRDPTDPFSHNISSRMIIYRSILIVDSSAYDSVFSNCFDSK